MTGAGELDLRLLGAPSVTVGGADLVVDTRKAIALLAYLAVTGRAHRRDHLAGLLWPDHETDRARGALRRTLSTLRTGLGGSWVGADRETVWCSLDDARVDVREFRGLAAEPAAHDHAPAEVCARCADPLAAAAAAHRDRFLAGFSIRDSPGYDDWQQGEADRLEAELHDVLGRLAEAYAVRGEWSAAAGAARRRVGLDPLQEPSHRQLMRMHALAGDRAAAMRQYRECVRVLDRDLGVPPLPETQELYARVQEGAVRGPAAPAPSAPSGRPPVLPPVERAVTGPPLLGRDLELQRLRGALAASAHGGALAALEGEAGVGKSRLVEEVVGEAAAAGAPAVVVRCYEGESGLAFGPVAAAVRAAVAAAPRGGRLDGVSARARAEAARLVPELDPGAVTATPAEPPDPGAQLRFLEALVEVLTCLASGDAGGLLVFEDLHHADAGTRDLAAFLARRVARHRLLLLATWRREDGGDELDVRRLAAEAERTGEGALLRLPRLDEAAVRSMARWARDRGLALDEAGESALWRETEGLPLLCVEYLQALREPGGSDPGSLPGARALLGARLDTLGPLATELAGAGAVLGRRFDFDLARQVSGREERAALEGTEELLRRGMCTEGDRPPVRGGAPPTLTFTHDLLRQLVLERLSLVRRRLLHLRAADALEGPAERDDGLAAAVAQHAELGGRDAQAARWHERAGRQALALPAPEAAIEHLRRARALAATPDPALDEAIADVQVLQGAYAEAIESFESAAARLAGGPLAEVERKLAGVHERRGRHDLAAVHVEAALAVADAGDDVALARIELQAASTAGRRGDPAAARRYAECALERAGRVGADEEAARAHDMLGLLAWGEGDVAAAGDHLERALALLSDDRSPAAVAGALNNLARVRRASGSSDEAVSLASRALALASATRDRHREAALHNNLADALHAAGRGAEAMEHLKRAVSIFAEVGQESGPEPDIWMLSHW